MSVASGGSNANYDRLEFVGDAVLDFRKHLSLVCLGLIDHNYRQWSLDTYGTAIPTSPRAV